jgi:hypothetical protein
MQCAKKLDVDVSIMAVDAEKALDRLEWPFLRKKNVKAFNFPA